eukprot:6189903-Pleurochrysis_carterae.AAC.7
MWAPFFIVPRTFELIFGLSFFTGGGCYVYLLAKACSDMRYPLKSDFEVSRTMPLSGLCDNFLRAVIGDSS